MAFQKGILVFASAGNEGSNAWAKIIAPSDGENVIAVGAVDKKGFKASFSSYGPAYGGAVKPNVAAMGIGTTLVTSLQVISYASGTSFSSPVMAGMGACLLQANPYCSAKQIKQAIEHSASQYAKPDSLLGYGIPDFDIADKYLKVNATTSLNRVSGWSVYPNPFAEYLVLKNDSPSDFKTTTVFIYTIDGIKVREQTFSFSGQIILNNLANLPNGILILKIRSGEKVETLKLVKTDR
jgi:subtilisin family serine protease